MAESLKPGDIVASNYRVLRHLGEGGFGTVFLAENLTLLEQKVVVKVLRDGEQGAGAAEARVLATLQHPNVVHVHAYDEKYDCIVMQFLAGKSAYELAPSLHPVTAIRLVQQTALALDAVHNKGLVHRDVKPQNVMVELKGSEVASVQLIDFGIAQTVGKVSRCSSGTLDYAAPELFPKSDDDTLAPAHPANDVYALGVMLFELCAHRPPFIGDTSVIVQQHVGARVPSIIEARRSLYAASDSTQVEGFTLEPREEKLLEEVDELVQAMMAKEMSARPDAKAVAYRLGQIEQEFSREVTQVGYRLPQEPILLTQRAKPTTMVLPKLAVPASEPTTGEIAAIRGKSRGRPIAAIAVVVLLLLLFGVLAGWPRGSGKVAEAIDAGVAVVAVAEPPKLAPAPVEAAGPEKEAPDASDDLTPLVPVARPAAVVAPTVAPAPVRVTAPKAATSVVVSAPECSPDAQWRKASLDLLGELAERASKRSVKVGLWFESQEASVSEKIRGAATRSDCSAVDAQLASLTRELSKQ